MKNFQERYFFLELLRSLISIHVVLTAYRICNQIVIFYQYKEEFTPGTRIIDIIFEPSIYIFPNIDEIFGVISFSILYFVWKKKNFFPLLFSITWGMSSGFYGVLMEALIENILPSNFKNYEHDILYFLYEIYIFLIWIILPQIAIGVGIIWLANFRAVGRNRR